VKRALIVFLFAFVFKASAQTPGPADCSQARDQYARMNDHLLLDHQDESDESPQVALKRTKDLTSFIARITIARLADMRDPSAIRAYLACMQERDETLPPEWSTNTPQIFLAKTPRSLIAVSSMVIMRGGDAIPNTRPVVQCFSEAKGKWTLIGAGGEEFDTHTFFIHPLKSPNPSESWYLLSGTAIGDTGGRLHLEVISCSASKYRKVWDRDELIWGEVQVSPDGIVLTYLKQEDEQTAEINGDKLGPGHIIADDSPDEDPKRFSETLRVTPNGLEP